jgi:hypothetical protein
MTLVPRAIAVFLLSSISMFAQDWPYVGRDHGGTRHSSLAQINRTNVAKLEIAWTFDTEDWSDGKDLPSRSSFDATRSSHSFRSPRSPFVDILIAISESGLLVSTEVRRNEAISSAVLPAVRLSVERCSSSACR